jgi:Uncharacterised nucleotidyltransferase
MRPDEEWLLVLADPEGVRVPLPGRRLDALGIASLCLLANMHGVLPAVLQQVERLLRDEPAKLLLDKKTVSEVSQAMGQVNDRLAQRSAMAMFLGAEAQRLVDKLAAAGVETIVLKGADFAVRLYEHSASRTFGDVDLLVRKSDWRTVDSTMMRLGYESREQPMKYTDGYSERSWEHPTMPGAMIEIHNNLVNSPTVRRGVSVRLEDLPLERGQDGRLRATPAGLLIIAAVHGAASHGFEKVQHLCDIAQVVRGRAGLIDEGSLRECVAKTGAGLSLATALDLTARSLNEPACVQLLKRLELRWPRRIVRLLMTPAVVVRSQGMHRRSVTWRRRMLRQMLKSSR